MFGIISGPGRPAYFHDVRLHVVGNIIDIRAGFVDGVSFDCLLGRKGFFDNFKVTFDQTEVPPQLLTERIIRPVKSAKKQN